MGMKPCSYVTIGSSKYEARVDWVEELLESIERILVEI